jgi:hypothetical protein
MQRPEARQRTWSWRRALQYRVLGSVFLLIGGGPLIIAVIHSPPWWFYILPLFAIIPGIIAVTYSEGVLIDPGKDAVVRWTQVLSIRREQSWPLSGMRGVRIKHRVSRGSSTPSVVYDVWLEGEPGSVRACTSRFEGKARSELDRITALTGLPEYPTTPV